MVQGELEEMKMNAEHEKELHEEIAIIEAGAAQPKTITDLLNRLQELDTLTGRPHYVKITPDGTVKTKMEAGE